MFVAVFYSLQIEMFLFVLFVLQTYETTILKFFMFNYCNTEDLSVLSGEPPCFLCAHRMAGVLASAHWCLASCEVSLGGPAGSFPGG